MNSGNSLYRGFLVVVTAEQYNPEVETVRESRHCIPDDTYLTYISQSSTLLEEPVGDYCSSVLALWVPRTSKSWGGGRGGMTEVATARASQYLYYKPAD